MTELDALADEVGVHGRTLRRAAGRGLLRAAGRGTREITIGASERRYVRSHWPLVARLLASLRTQPSVRLAVLYGSVARGSDRPDSDLDLLVDLRRDDPRVRARLVDVLQDASGRRVHLVSLRTADAVPVLLADVLAEGRVLVDRDGAWRRLKAHERRIARRAAAEDEKLLRLAWEAPAAIEEVAQGLRRASR